MFNRDEIVARITTLKRGVEEMRVYLKIEERKERLAQAEARQAEPGFWDNPEAARGVITEGNAEKAFIYPLCLVLTQFRKGKCDSGRIRHG